MLVITSKAIPRHSDIAVLPKPAITHTTYTKQSTDTVGEDFGPKAT